MRCPITGILLWASILSGCGASNHVYTQTFEFAGLHCTAANVKTGTILAASENAWLCADRFGAKHLIVFPVDRGVFTTVESAATATVTLPAKILP